MAAVAIVWFFLYPFVQISGRFNAASARLVHFVIECAYTTCEAEFETYWECLGPRLQDGAVFVTTGVPGSGVDRILPADRGPVRAELSTA